MYACLRRVSGVEIKNSVFGRRENWKGEKNDFETIPRLENSNILSMLGWLWEPRLLERAPNRILEFRFSSSKAFGQVFSRFHLENPAYFRENLFFRRRGLIWIPHKAKIKLRGSELRTESFVRGQISVNLFASDLFSVRVRLISIKDRIW